MDLVQSVRKEGSRGGRDQFKWEDVKTSAHRENYLGHSLMAPVGRWQKNKDLSWYSKGDVDGEDMSEADARKKELELVKRAEKEAMAKQLGYELPTENPNMTAIGAREEPQSLEPSKQQEEQRERKHRHGRERHRHRDRSRDDRDRRTHRRHRSVERKYRHRSRSCSRSRSRSRSRSPERRRPGSRERDRRRQRDPYEERRRYSDRDARRSRSPRDRRR